LNLLFCTVNLIEVYEKQRKEIIFSLHSFELQKKEKTQSKELQKLKQMKLRVKENEQQCKKKEVLEDKKRVFKVLIELVKVLIQPILHS